MIVIADNGGDPIVHLIWDHHQSNQSLHVYLKLEVSSIPTPSQVLNILLLYLGAQI